MKAFTKRKSEINQHNRLYDDGLVTFQMEANAFGDLYDDEFMAFVNGLSGFESPFE